MELDYEEERNKISIKRNDLKPKKIIKEKNGAGIFLLVFCVKELSFLTIRMAYVMFVVTDQLVEKKEKLG